MSLTPRERCFSTLIRGLVLAVSSLPMLLAQGLPPLPSYYGIRQWGWDHFDTDSRLLPITSISADFQHTAVIRSDGRLYVQGQDNPYMCRVPPGSYTAVDIGYRKVLGIRSDGTAVGWGDWATEPIPPLPPGLSYVDVAAGMYHNLFLRSDGSVVASGSNQYGQLNVPALPPGVVATKIHVVMLNSVMLGSNGAVYAWGDNSEGQCNVPPLPSGMVYTDVSCNQTFALAVRSDGQLIAWGSNYIGETSPPQAPPGVSYLHCAAGSNFGVAWRSDGQLVAWGRNDVGQLMVPQAPPGTTLWKLEAGNGHGVVLWSDGSVSGWGQTEYFPYEVFHPTRGKAVAAPGDRFTGVSAGFAHTLVLRADGQVEGLGFNVLSVCVAPPLPPGMVYTKVRAGTYLSAALRSDGELLVWGGNQYGQTNVPARPSGTTYSDIELGSAHVLALRSDGACVAFGLNNFGQCNVPQLPAGMTFVDIEAEERNSWWLRSDGTIFRSGIGGAGSMTSSTAGAPFVSASTAGLRADGTIQVHPSPFGSWVIPSLPWGQYYVGIEIGTGLYLRRSDGRVVCVHAPVPFMPPWYVVPPLDPGTSFLDVVAGGDNVSARVGGTCTYTGIAPGCSGSRPATRLVPRDTPRIGRTLEVTLFDLPDNIAIMAMGWQQLSTPLDLGVLGMPGCSLAISVDGTAGLFGQDHRAKWLLPIPDLASLLGLRFYNQALVLDTSAPNSFLAVMSDAMQAVVGWP